jgi:DeoR/GlpR family transcriptional regulator of sugar metabolism
MCGKPKEDTGGAYLKVEDRRLEIVGLLEKEGRVEVAELSALLGVSEMTIRRDFEVLEEQGVLKRVRGAAVSAASRSYEPPFVLRAGRNHEAKSRIGQAAAATVSEGETVILDVGTTALAVAEALKDRRNLTIVTPNLRAAWLLADNPELRVIVTGGIVRPRERSLIGSFAERAFENLYCDTFIMGVGGVDVEAGLTEFNLEDARVKQEALRYSRRCVVAADSTKLGNVAFARVAGIDRADVLITDDDAEPEKAQKLRAAGLEVETV